MIRAVEWCQMPKLLVWLGFPEFYRWVYAPAMIGGGIDGMEFSRHA